jgi:hypothetical protein
MVGRVRRGSRAVTVAALLAMGGVAVGCGKTSLEVARPAADVQPIAAGEDCPATVMSTLRSVLLRVYGEGIESERVLSARRMIERSQALRGAVERGDAPAARLALEALLATGHVTDVQIVKGGKAFVALGGPALAPLHGTLTDAHGHELARYVASVWADGGFAAEADGIAAGTVALRAGPKSIGGTIALPEGPLAPTGRLTRNGTVFQYTSFPAQTYPSGTATVYLLKPLDTVQALCGASGEDTVVNTLTRVANLIYEGELGSRTHVQISRVQRDGALLSAVAQNDPLAIEAAIKALLNHHVVRLRVSARGRLLSDVGGPFVLAPVTAPLRLHGRRIGSFVLSIQDDEGYLRLAKRLAGLKVLMYMEPHPGTPQLVKNSLGPNPGQVPTKGRYSYKGQSFRVLTIEAEAFPSGPLHIRVLVPIPYS